MSKNVKPIPATSPNKKRIAVVSIAAVLLVVVVTLIIVLAGGTKVAKVEGSNDAYLTSNGTTITKGEVYDALKSQGVSILSTLIDKKIFESVVIDYTNDELARTKLDELVNTALYGSTDVDVIKENFDGNPAVDTADTIALKANLRAKNIKTFVSNLFLVNPKINQTELIAALTANTDYNNYHLVGALKEQYNLNVAQHLFASKILDEELADQKINDEKTYNAALVTQFKNEQLVNYSLDLFYIRFINASEGQQYLRYFGLVTGANGIWYQLPILPTNDDGAVTFGSLLDPSKAVTQANIDATENAEIKKHMESIKNVIDVDGVKHDTLYAFFTAKGYVPNRHYTKLFDLLSKNIVSLALPELNNANVLRSFVNIHNTLNNDTLKVVENADKTLNVLTATDEQYQLTYQKDDEGDIKGYTSIFPNVTTLRSLARANKLDDDGELVDEGKKPYVSNISTISNFLVFKFNDGDVNDYKNFLNSNSTEFKVLDEETGETTLTEALEAELLVAIKKSRLTSTYVTTKVTEHKKDLKLDIYDEKLRLLYSQSVTTYSGTTKGHKTLVMKLELGDVKFELTADEFYKIIEPVYGVNIALDLLVKEALLSSDVYTITDTERKDYETQYATLLSNFAANAFETNGYPATLGREKFLKLVFDADNKEGALINGYILPRLKELYSYDYEAHYGSDVYSKLANLTSLQSTHYKSITVGHVLAFIDTDLDGTPVNPAEYFTGDKAGERENFENKVLELIDLIKADNTYNTVAGLQEVITLYNSVGRYDTDSSTQYPAKVNKYVEYRKLGIALKYESISSAVTNTSNFLTSSSRLDKVFYDRAIALYDLHSALDSEGNPTFDADNFPRPFIDTVANREELKDVTSTFGYHFLILDNTGDKATFMNPVNPSAAFTDDTYNFEDSFLGSSEKTYSLNGDSDNITASQIEYYLQTLRTSLTGDDAPKGLPTSSTTTKVHTAFSTFFTPVKTMYDNTYHQRYLTFKLVDSLNFTFADSTKNAYYAQIKEININQFFSFLEEGVDANYDNLYRTWFTILEA